ncbi:hypothetical protein N7537_010358 [Penicillium hordei]|uniref:Uncharacterized protein n=1 Tax=Penicillium hordei TaxID=40994 RepID=A0AAD6DW09_9EURO|nr:uncharacterized protein N7537_010358 [Penicillium hordei]KAJ5593454.1 hypothetical protein N7537_010358 [Penicillium hordei]
MPNHVASHTRYAQKWRSMKRHAVRWKVRAQGGIRHRVALVCSADTSFLSSEYVVSVQLSPQLPVHSVGHSLHLLALRLPPSMEQTLVVERKSPAQREKRLTTFNGLMF